MRLYRVSARSARTRHTRMRIRRLEAMAKSDSARARLIGVLYRPHRARLPPQHSPRPRPRARPRQAHHRMNQPLLAQAPRRRKRCPSASRSRSAQSASRYPRPPCRPPPTSLRGPTRPRLHRLHRPLARAGKDTAAVQATVARGHSTPSQRPLRRHRSRLLPAARSPRLPRQKRTSQCPRRARRRLSSSVDVSGCSARPHLHLHLIQHLQLSHRRQHHPPSTRIRSLRRRSASLSWRRMTRSCCSRHPHLPHLRAPKNSRRLRKLLRSCVASLHCPRRLEKAQGEALHNPARTKNAVPQLLMPAASHIINSRHFLCLLSRPLSLW